MPPNPAASRRRGRPRLKPDELQDTSTVQALERGLLLLKLLGQQESATLSDLSLQMGLPVSTAHRLLKTLEKQGFVDLDYTSQQWAVGIETYAAGSRYLHRTSLVDAAKPAMHSLMQDTGETANLATLSGDGEITFLTQVDSLNPVRAFHLTGTRSHVHCSGIGKALLAELADERVTEVLQRSGMPRLTAKTLTQPKTLFADLQETHRRGWSLDDEECYAGMRCIASAIHDAGDQVIAGVSISGPVMRFPDSKLATLGERVQQAAAEITRCIGGEVPDRSSPH